MCRIRRNNLPDNKPIEQHVDAGEALFDRWLFMAGLLHFLDLSGDVKRLHSIEPIEASVFTPIQEAAGREAVSISRVLVPDVYGEELNETREPSLARAREQSRRHTTARHDLELM